MRHARIQQAKPERSFAERIVAVIVAVAMLGGMGYATTSAAMAANAEQTTEQQAGISLGLYDYNRDTINNDHALKFKNAGPEEYNSYVGEGKGAYTGIVKKTLTNGYPTTTVDKGSESLDYLFGGKPDDKAVTIHKPTGGLLTLGEDGYYGFDADFQKATYDEVSKKFTVDKQPCTNQSSTPCFAPFGYDTEENKYSFGMNLGADFYMPKDGRVNNKDMMFDFTGDDDVWVFIDGVLVLDLGGIHQALDGSINFATGKITYDKPQSNGNSPGNSPAATIAEAFSKAGETWDSTPYKTHHLSFFYLERGDGGSNCKIKFNLPVKPSKAIDIEKETLGTIDANEQFQFQLFVGGSLTPYQGKYSVYNAYTNQVVRSDLQTSNNGVITLTKGQFARVQSDDFTDDTTYTVRELNSSGYTVSANGSPMTQQDSGGSAYAETGSFTVGKTSHVTIVNSNVKPSNNKSIEKTIGGDGDEYRLHLTASGDSTSSTVTTTTPADIVLVMDKSNSMKGERDSNAQEAANKLANKLLTTENSNLSEDKQVRMAVVTFSTHVDIEQQFTDNASDINSAVKGDPKGGTNWEAALKQANGLQGRRGVKKHIIFLADGDPTYRISDYPIGCWYACNPDDRWDTPEGVHGAGTEGSDNRYGYNYDAALAEANKRVGDAALYVVKTSTEAKKMAKLAIEANAVNGKEFDGTNAENLTNAFDQIYSTITSSAKIKVFSITDTLSQWVDLVKFAGCANGTDITQCVTVRNGNTKLTGYTATYNSGNRTVTVTFKGTDGTEGIVAEKADDIDVSFKVKPSDDAYADYAKNIKNNKYPENNNYPHTGDADTGDASAKQPGYHSNVDAKLNYCVLTEVNGATSCEKTEAGYPLPVVQVKLGKIKIVKQWSDGNDKHAKDSVTVQLQRKAIGATTNAENVDSPITLTLNADNKWTATVDNLVPGYTYSVVETSIDDRYDVSYAGNNADLTKKMVWSSKADAGTLNATITNTRKTVSLSNAISVKKNLTGREWKDSDQFSFTLEAKNNAPLPASCKEQKTCTVVVKADSKDHSAAFSDITYNAGGATYTYYVTEDSGSISALHYSQAKYEVEVTVAKNDAGAWTASVTSVTKVQDDNGNKVSGPQSDSTQPVAFTNHYIAVSALPLTGGMTDRQWLFVGGVVGGLAVLLIGAAGVWNGKKRLV